MLKTRLDPANETSDATALRSLQWAVFLVSMPLLIISLMLPVYGREVGADVVEIGVFFSAFFLVVVVLRPVVGWGVDRIGRRPFLLAGLALHCVGFVGFAFATSVGSILVMRIVQGIASSVMWLSAYSITADLAGEEGRGSAFGLVLQANSQGSIAGVIFGFLLLNASLNWHGRDYYQGTWRDLFLVYGLLSLAAVVLTMRRMPETRPPLTGAIQRPIVWSRAWVTLLLMAAVIIGSYTMLIPILVVYVQDTLGTPIELIALAVVPAALIWATLPARFGKLADRVGRKPLMVGALILACLSSLAIPSAAVLIALSFLVAVQALCFAASEPAVQALVADLTGNDQRGRAYGLYALAAGIGSTIGPVSGAWLYQNVSPGAPFYVNGIVMGLSALALAVLLRLPPRRGNIPALSG